jgi:predicted regulator of Ras-like GTPase activity (Roadblock/LC7/MglB family)
LKNIFSKIFSSCNSIYATLISTTDGHPLVKQSRVNLNESTLAAMTSSCIALGDRIATEVEQNGCELTLIQNTEGYLAIKRVSRKWVITVLADKNVNLGLLLTATKNAAKLLEEELLASIKN